MTPGLDHCENVVIVPHIASASLWTRSGMVGSCTHGMPLLAGCLTASLRAVCQCHQQSQCFCIIHQGMPHHISSYEEVSNFKGTTATTMLAGCT